MVKLIRKLLKSFLRKKSGEELVRSWGVRMGVRCKFISPQRSMFSSEPYMVELGDHVEVTSGVRFLPHDGAVWIFRGLEPNVDVIRPIKVGNNVFIGYGSIILGGAVIGDNCIIGAGSIVVGIIPSNTVVAGVPAKPIKGIDDYRESIEPWVVNTKKMNSGQKACYLKKKFGIIDAEKAH